MHRFIIFLLLFPLTACSHLSPIRVTDQRTGIEYVIPERLTVFPGIEELAKACVTDAGRVVHRTVEVDGYLNPEMAPCDEACWHMAALMKFKYNEFEIRDPKRGDYLQESGIWRISRGNVDDPRCQKAPTEFVRTIAKREGWTMDFCIAMEKVKESKARYTPGSVYQKSFLVTPEGARIARNREYVTDLVDNEELGFDIGYTLYGPRNTVYQGSSLSCPSIGINPPGRISGRWLQYDVIKPR